MKTKFSNDELLTCAKRELAMRKRLYRRWVDEDRLPQDKAETEIALMAAIVEYFESLHQLKLL